MSEISIPPSNPLHLIFQLNHDLKLYDEFRNLIGIIKIFVIVCLHTPVVYMPDKFSTLFLLWAKCDQVSSLMSTKTHRCVIINCEPFRLETYRACVCVCKRVLIHWNQYVAPSYHRIQWGECFLYRTCIITSSALYCFNIIRRMILLHGRSTTIPQNHIIWLEDDAFGEWVERYNYISWT